MRDAGIGFGENTVMGSFLNEEVLARYEPVALIGQGGVATVWKAVHRASGRNVAIKHFHGADGDRALYFQELSMILQLRHPHIVRCYDLWDPGGDSADLVFEFADRGSLRDHLRSDEAWSAERSAAVLVQVLRGLAYAHGRSVVHRDLKPENVLCFSPGIYKCSDFGMARYLVKESNVLTNAGSPAYMAPEQFYDQHDGRADVYALGILWYEMLHGRLPFSGSSVAIFNQHLSAPLPIRSDLDPEVADLLVQMAAKSASDRPAVADAIAEMERLLENAGYVQPASVTEALARDEHEPPEAVGDMNAFGLSRKMDDTHRPSQSTREADGDRSLAPTRRAHASGGPFVDSDWAVAPDREAAGAGPRPRSPGYETLSAKDLFGGEAVPAPHATPGVSPSRGQAVFPTGTAVATPSSSRSTFGAEHLFGDAFGPSVPEDSSVLQPGAIVRSPDESERERATSSFPFAETAESAGSLFVRPTFEEVGSIAAVATSRLRASTPGVSLSFGLLRLDHLWSRAVDTGSRCLVNADDGRELLVVTRDGLHGLDRRAGRAGKVMSGAVELVGVAGAGNLPCVVNDELRLIWWHELSEARWSLSAELTSVAVAPDASAIATVSGGAVHCYDIRGECLWSGRFADGGDRVVVSFDSGGELMVVRAGCGDTAIRFFDRTGDCIARHDLGEPIVAASRCRGGEGAWVVTEGPAGCAVARVACDAIVSEPTAIERPLHDLVGGRGWLCGRSDGGDVYVVDPVSGATTRLVLRGSILHYEAGAEEEELFVLEERDGCLRYVAAFGVHYVGARLDHAGGAWSAPQPEDDGGRRCD